MSRKTENMTPFTRLSTKNACEIDNPDVRAKEPILLISISVLFCLFLVSKGELETLLAVEVHPVTGYLEPPS